MSAPRTERWRPQFHYTPAANWMNDPNGLVHFDGEYHLFYQYNPFGATWGHMSWGHAVSTDMLHWQELPVALAADDETMVFSGSIVIDTHNTAGFAAPGETALVAIYTGAQRREGGLQNQQLAWSIDRGRTWARYAGNPVLDLGLRDFRDPKVIWHAPTSRWIMAVVLPDRHLVSFYASGDLKAWRHCSDFGPAGSSAGIWECPDLFTLPIDGEPGARAWVLKVDVFEGHVAGGSGAQYFVGHFDGERFTAEAREGAPMPVRWGDFGADFYAAMTWPDPDASRGRAVWIGWMSDHHYGAQLPTAPWCGAMTLPRCLSLRRGPTGLALRQMPIDALAALRGAHRAVPAENLADAERALALPEPDARALDIEIRFDAIAARETGLRLGCGDGESLTIGFDAGRGAAFVDRTRAGHTPPHPAFGGRRYAPIGDAHGGSLALRIVIDWSSVEVFVNGGEAALTEQFFPTGDTRSLAVYAEGGHASIASIDIWSLDASMGPHARAPAPPTSPIRPPP